MARIRSIHPGLFTDEEFMALTMEAPLACVLLTGIWCECDDDGVFDWKVLTLKARYLPVADADVEALLKALEGKRFVRSFEKDGKPYGAVRNFRKYQRPKSPNTRGLLPNELREYVGLEPISSEPMGNHFGNDGEKLLQREEGGGREGGEKEEEGKKEAHASARPLSNGSDPPKQKPKAKRGTRLPEQWKPPPEGWQMAVEALGTEGAERQLETFRDHWRAQSGQRGVKLDWPATWRNWVRRAPDFGPSARGSPKPNLSDDEELALIERYLENGNH